MLLDWEHPLSADPKMDCKVFCEEAGLLGEHHFKGMASVVSGVPHADADTAKLAIDQLVSWANDAENSEA